MISFLGEKVGAMHGLILLTLLMSWSMPAECSIATAVDNVEEVKRFFRATNLGIGVYSRTATLNAITKKLQGKPDADVQEQLNQVNAVLWGLDVLGGGAVPVIDDILDSILTSREFDNTRKLWTDLSEHLKGTWRGAILGEMTPEQYASEVYARKQVIFNSFEDEVRALNPNSRQLKYINKAKKWFRVKTVAKVLGPLFDTISIGINAWTIATTRRDCATSPHSCNYAALASGGLGIVAGGVGFITFCATLAGASAAIGPAGAILAATLTIVATLIELYWPPNDRWIKDYNSQVSMMQNLLRYSRFQLYNSNQFLARNSGNNTDMSDVYVLNQGHLPKWKMVHTMGKVDFGKRHSDNPRRELFVNGRCSHPIHDATTDKPPGGSDPGAGRFCPYLIDGNHVSGSHGRQDLGYGFYGFTRSATTTNQNTDFPTSGDYAGSTVLITTDKVQRSVLQEENLDAKLRGFCINTQTKTGGDTGYDDAVYIGHMKNLDNGETVEVITGGGNDALIIEGMLGPFSRNPTGGRLKAELGTSGHNVLNLHGISETEIKGIKYDPQNGELKYFHGTDRSEHLVGTVTNVEILGASPFNDYIKLYASKTGESNDFTVFKYKGQATYELDISSIDDLSFAPTFMIVDKSDNGAVSNPDCTNHHPMLLIKNLPSNAVINDILYNGDTISIHGNKQEDDRKRSTNSSFGKRKRHGKQKRNGHKQGGKRDRTRGTETGQNTKRHGSGASKRTTCTAQQEDNSSEGGKEGKELLATVAFHTKCPAKVEAKKVGNVCLMAPRELGKLDLVFGSGERITSDFTQDVTGSVCTLLCPSQAVTSKRNIDLSGASSGTLVINEDLFLDPCNIGLDVSLTISRVRDAVWGLSFTSTSTTAKFRGAGTTQEVTGLDRIVNENGEELYDIAEMNKMMRTCALTMTHVKLMSSWNYTMITQRKGPKELLVGQVGHVAMRSESK